MARGDAEATSRKPGPPPKLETIDRRVIGCTKCPELRRYCESIGREKRKAFRDWTYWTRPVPGFGDRAARIMIVGLAPAAHGANRTGRIFTGDRSGDFLYAALHRAGLANQPQSVSRDDGLKLSGVYITASLRCAPPGNRPNPHQLDNCRPYLVDEIRRLKPAVLLCLGRIGWDTALAALADAGETIPSPRPKFEHDGRATIGERTLLASYHVSQQNTFTGRLTEAMFDRILDKAKNIASL